MSRRQALGTSVIVDSEVGRRSGGNFFVIRDLVQSQFVLDVVSESEQNISDVGIPGRYQSHCFLNIRQRVFESPGEQDYLKKKKKYSNYKNSHIHLHTFRHLGKKKKIGRTLNLLELWLGRNTLRTTTVSASELFPRTPRTRRLPVMYKNVGRLKNRDSSEHKTFASITDRTRTYIQLALTARSV